MSKRYLLALAIVPLLMFGCTKSKKDPAIKMGTYYEVDPVDGGSIIEFRFYNRFFPQNLRTSSDKPVYEYKYRIEDGKMILTPPSIDSYLPPNPVRFTFTDDGLTIDNFRPPMFGQASTIRFKRR